MPNLVGIFDPHAPSSELEHDLVQMMDAVDYPSFRFARVRASGESIAAGNVLPGIEDNRSQPARDPNRRIWLLLDGEIMDRHSLEKDLSKSGVDVVGKDDAQLALASYVAYGDRFHERINGAWNLVLHDSIAEATFVITDRIGSRLLFFAQDGRRFVFANELKGVIAGRKVRSAAGGIGLMQLLSSGAQVGRYTWIDGIQLIEPGTVIRLDRHGVHHRRYWRFHFEEGGPRMPERSYAELARDLLLQATERAMKLSDRYPVAIMLSGGLDSRAVALSIPKRCLPLDAITYGNRDAPDVRYARQLAEVIGLRHHWIEGHWPQIVKACQLVYRRHLEREVVLSYHSAQLERVVWRAEALLMFDDLSSMIWHPLYRQHMRFMLNGAAGDALTGSHVAPYQMLRPGRDKVIDRHFAAFFFQDRELVRRIARQAFIKRWEGELRERFNETFAQIDADEPTALASVWDMENRQRRGAFFSFTIERYFCTCRTPFIDYDLADHLASIPPWWRFQQRIYKRMIVDGFPEAAHVPWAYTNGRITTSPMFEFAREAFNFARARVRSMLALGNRDVRRWDFRDTTTLMREDFHLTDTLLEFTRSDGFPSDILDEQGVRWLVDEFRSRGGFQLRTMFSHLLGLAKATELFLIPDRIHMPPLADPAEFGVCVNDNQG